MPSSASSAFGDYPAGTRLDDQGQPQPVARPVYGLALCGLKAVPLSGKVDLFAKAGALLWSAGARGHRYGLANWTDSTDRGKDSGALVVGAGLDADLFSRVTLRVEGLVFSRVLGAPATLWSAGVLWRF